eukprot:5963321-Amphidinium_carterae.2
MSETETHPSVTGVLFALAVTCCSGASPGGPRRFIKGELLIFSIANSLLLPLGLLVIDHSIGAINVLLGQRSTSLFVGHLLYENILNDLLRLQVVRPGALVHR